MTLHGERCPAWPVRVYLVEASFAEADAADPDACWPAGRELDVELEVCRRAGRELTVRLTLSTGDVSESMVRVTYGCDYQLGDDVPDAQLDACCEALVFEGAPTLLYPYVRDEVARLTVSSRLGTYLLPFMPPPLGRLPDFAMPGVTREEEDGTEARRSTW